MAFLWRVKKGFAIGSYKVLKRTDSNHRFKGNRRLIYTFKKIEDPYFLDKVREAVAFKIISEGYSRLSASKEIGLSWISLTKFLKDARCKINIKLLRRLICWSGYIPEIRCNKKRKSKKNTATSD
jgi:hypothetical protein